ncbi:MAG TPA: PAS domain-containing sensor histidine kinase, partial [Xanthobacteraceae bacterium]|nr:PAS domain-containing sensor histidine kinase [Xanthobacteraceae bacterium]
MTIIEDVAVAERGSGATAPRLGTRFLGPIAIVLALLSALVTFLVLTGLTPILPTHEVVVSVLLANAFAVLLLTSIIGWELWQIVQARREGRAGARLHVRIIGLFSVIAAIPAILVAVVASITLDRGLDRWFSARTRAVIENSMSVAEAYVREHAEMIRGDIVAMAFDIGRAKPLFDQDRARFRQFLNAQASLRGLPAAMIIDKDQNAIERVGIQEGRGVSLPPKETLAQITATEPRIALVPDTDDVASVIRLNGYDDYYLYVARPLVPRVLDQLKATQASVAEYASLEARRVGVQVAFALMYTVIALIVLLSAVWIGLNFANRLVAPIRRLISAANLVSTGNLFVQVPVRGSEGDLARLGESFNKMTQELRTQRDDIVHARDVIDRRRRFTEAVLSAASAGVIGLDEQERISILNRSAEKLIGRTEGEVLGHELAEIVPELAPLLDAARAGYQRMIQGQVTINRNGRERNVSVRVTTDQQSDAEHGYVITLDDITDLVMAQRSSAWADIARRIAHEIKNPLTPIQLSAERLKRKYGKVIIEDRAVFEQCTDTIVRQVDDIKRMVDEFSRFARMPKPVIAEEDVADTIRQVVFLMQVAQPDIEFHVQLSEDPMLARFDRRLISQALTNIVKNATEAVAAVLPAEGGKGEIRISAERAHDEI